MLGFDIIERVVDGLNAGRSHVKDISDEQLGAVVQAGRFEATTDMSRMGEPDAISICVPTPLSKFKDPDVSYIVAATEAVKRTLRRGQAIILESTTYPGHHPGDPPAGAGEHRASGGRGLLPGLQPRAGGPGQPD